MWDNLHLETTHSASDQNLKTFSRGPLSDPGILSGYRIIHLRFQSPHTYGELGRNDLPPLLKSASSPIPVRDAVTTILDGRKVEGRFCLSQESSAFIEM